MHISDGEVAVRVIPGAPEDCARFPAAFAVMSEAETVYFEEAIDLKYSEVAEFHEFVENHMKTCPQEHLNAFFKAVILRKDVLNVVGNLDKKIIVCTDVMSHWNGTEWQVIPRYVNDPLDNDRCLRIFPDERLYARSIDSFLV